VLFIQIEVLFDRIDQIFIPVGLEP